MSLPAYTHNDDNLEAIDGWYQDEHVEYAMTNYWMKDDNSPWVIRKFHAFNEYALINTDGDHMYNKHLDDTIEIVVHAFSTLEAAKTMYRILR